MPPLVASVLEPAELEAMRARLKQLPEPPVRARLGGDDWRGALGVFLLVFLSTFPVVIPFIVMQRRRAGLARLQRHRRRPALRGRLRFGRITGRRPVVAGIVMVVFGAILVGLTIALGG